MPAPLYLDSPFSFQSDIVIREGTLLLHSGKPSLYNLYFNIPTFLASVFYSFICTDFFVDYFIYMMLFCFTLNFWWTCIRTPSVKYETWISDESLFNSTQNYSSHFFFLVWILNSHTIMYRCVVAVDAIKHEFMRLNERLDAVLQVFWNISKYVDSLNFNNTYTWGYA